MILGASKEVRIIIMIGTTTQRHRFINCQELPRIENLKILIHFWIKLLPIRDIILNILHFVLIV